LIPVFRILLLVALLLLIGQLLPNILDLRALVLPLDSNDLGNVGI
jgi:hypothetical protein